MESRNTLRLCEAWSLVGRSWPESFRRLLDSLDGAHCARNAATFNEQLLQQLVSDPLSQLAYKRGHRRRASAKQAQAWDQGHATASVKIAVQGVLGAVVVEQHVVQVV